MQCAAGFPNGTDHCCSTPSQLEVNPCLDSSFYRSPMFVRTPAVSFHVSTELGRDRGSYWGNQTIAHAPTVRASVSDVVAAFGQCDMDRPTQPDPGVPGSTALVSSCSCGPLKYAYRIVIMRTMYSKNHVK